MNNPFKDRQFVPWHSGWKTYAVCVIGMILGILQGLDKSGVVHHIVIPGWVNWTLAFLGMAAVRNSISIRSQYITQTLCDLLKIMATQLTIPTPVEEPRSPSLMPEPVEVSELSPVRGVGTGPQQGVSGLRGR